MASNARELEGSAACLNDWLGLVGQLFHFVAGPKATRRRRRQQRWALLGVIAAWTVLRASSTGFKCAPQSQVIALAKR